MIALNQPGEAFPQGSYTVRVEAIGQRDGQPFDVWAELPIKLVDPGNPQPEE